jgi:hypothetical protein
LITVTPRAIARVQRERDQVAWFGLCCMCVSNEVAERQHFGQDLLRVRRRGGCASGRADCGVYSHAGTIPVHGLPGWTRLLEPRR